MRLFLATAVAAVFTAGAVTSALAADVGVSIDIGQPGFYGHLDIGGYPQPQVIYREPMIIERGERYGPPVYLRVPPGHAKHWSKHCREYHACGERVYFVQDSWYSHEYAPRYQEHHRDKHDNRHGDDRDDRGDHDDDDHGHGHGGKHK